MKICAESDQQCLLAFCWSASFSPTSWQNSDHTHFVFDHFDIFTLGASWYMLLDNLVSTMEFWIWENQVGPSAFFFPIEKQSSGVWPDSFKAILPVSSTIDHDWHASSSRSSKSRKNRTWVWAATQIGWVSIWTRMPKRFQATCLALSS